MKSDLEVLVAAEEDSLIQSDAFKKTAVLPPEPVRKRDWCGALVLVLYIPAYVGL